MSILHGVSLVMLIGCVPVLMWCYLPVWKMDTDTFRRKLAESPKSFLNMESPDYLLFYFKDGKTKD